jgi:FkbM family methyltransferase
MFIHKLIRGHAPQLYNPLLKIYLKLFDFNTKSLNRNLKKKLRLLESKSVFISIGTNDGFSNDPFVEWVLNSDCRAAFIEPVPEVFSKLRKNYEDVLPSCTRLTFHNIAMSEATEKTSFFAVSSNAKTELGDLAPYWVDQLGSVDRDHILKHLDGILEPYIYEFEIETTTLNDFLKSNDFSGLDVLHIDTEGCDYRIFSTLNLDLFQPKIILIEHKHLNADELIRLQATLVAHGYEIQKFRSDLLATKN